MNTESRLTEWQRRKLCEVILLGCDRTTACHYVSATPGHLQAEIARDEAFGREVARAEAQAEVRHMGNIHSAAKSEKNWRTSVWWLERRDQRHDDEGDGPADRHLRELVQAIGQAIVAEIAEVAVQRRLLERIFQIMTGVGVSDEPPASDVPRLPAPVLDQPPHDPSLNNPSLNNPAQFS
jgi:hypothetical protein